MKSIVALLLILSVVPAYSQQTDTLWTHGLVAGLTLTQVSFTDWAAGGENALAYSFSADGKSILNVGVWNWENKYQFAFGQTRLGDQELRKTDDKIDLSSILTWKIGTFINPYFGLTVKTQFAKGFTYNALGNKFEVSKFFDPAYITQSAGVGYQPSNIIKTRLGLALREIVTDDFPQYANDPSSTDIRKVAVDGGL